MSVSNIRIKGWTYFDEISRMGRTWHKDKLVTIKARLVVSRSSTLVRRRFALLVCFFSTILWPEWNYKCPNTGNSILDSAKTKCPVTWICLSTFWDNGSGVTKVPQVTSHAITNIKLLVLYQTNKTESSVQLNCNNFAVWKYIICISNFIETMKFS